MKYNVHLITKRLQLTQPNWIFRYKLKLFWYVTPRCVEFGSLCVRIRTLAPCHCKTQDATRWLCMYSLRWQNFFVLHFHAISL